MNKYLNNVLHNIITPPFGNYYPDSLSLEAFFWLFGPKFEPIRKIQLYDNGEIFKFEIDVDKNCMNLLRGIRNYLWGMEEEKGNNYIYKDLLDYFLSIYPHYNIEFFSKNIQPSHSFKVGSKISRANYSYPRWFIASLNNIVTEWDLDDDYEELDSLIINDENFLKKLKSGFERLEMPEEYYKLENYVIDLGSQCLEA
ncbi:MAG: hypothetical protein HRU20_17305 [Pseudomonadales bacterium]|nr:hypothetical protein [Pseudomonadales bacterium]